MAPEVVLGKSRPGIKTDSFSLAVVLFLLFTGNHSLEGKNTCPPCMTPKLERKYFGENPVFIFDPVDDSNRPVPGLHKGAIGKWPILPDYLQAEFIKAFSKELLTDPNRRIIDQEWLRLFIRLRGEIFKCPGKTSSPCGRVYFADPVNPNPCPKCGKVNPFIAYIKTPRYNVPLHQWTSLYACHTQKDSEDFQTLTGEAVLTGNVIALKNVSGEKWSVTVNGKTSAVEPNQAVGLAKGMTFNFGSDATAEIV
jgi:serine/threonine protein kinase